MSECLVFSLRKKTLRENTRPYRYHGLKIFTSLRLRFQDFQRKSVNNPRIKIYQTGKLDSVLLGGTQNYGKLHAKSVVFGDVGYVGTSNFDYRSRSFNNEFGFFFKGDQLAADLKKVFADLKAKSYR